MAVKKRLVEQTLLYLKTWHTLQTKMTSYKAFWYLQSYITVPVCNHLNAVHVRKEYCSVAYIKAEAKLHVKLRCFASLVNNNFNVMWNMKWPTYLQYKKFICTCKPYSLYSNLNSSRCGQMQSIYDHLIE